MHDMEDSKSAEEVGERRSSTSWRRIDPAEEEFPGRVHDNNDLDDYDELLKVRICNSW